MWKSVFFSQNIWKGQIGLETLIFVLFLSFDDLKPAVYLRQTFPPWESLHENWPFSNGLWKGHTDPGTQIFGQILPFSDLQQYAIYQAMIKNCDLEGYDMKAALFF